MKKLSVLFLVGIMILMAGCGTSPAASSSTQTTGNAAQGFNNNDPLPLSSQLALGTIKLKDTPNAVTAEQAKALLPVWEALQSMSNNNNPAQLEFDALVAQIQTSLQPNQVQAITGMKLTNADIQTSMQELGLNNGFGGRGGNGTPVARTPNAQGGQGGRGGNDGPPGGFGGPGGFTGPGGVPGGIPGGVPGGIPGGEQGGFNGTPGVRATLSPAIQATAMARSTQRAQFGNPLLINAVIMYLQTLAGK